MRLNCAFARRLALASGLLTAPALMAGTAGAEQRPAMAPAIAPPSTTPPRAATSDQPDPPSPRAAAAAARAAEALAHEDSGFEGSEPGATELIPADETAMSSQPVTAGNKRTTSAAMKCIAGC